MIHKITVDHFADGEVGPAVLTAPGLSASREFPTAEEAMDFAAQHAGDWLPWYPAQSCDGGVCLWLVENEEAYEWLTNIAKNNWRSYPHNPERELLHCGRPMATETYTEQQLRELGMVGVYAARSICPCGYELYKYYTRNELDVPGFCCSICGRERNPMESEDDARNLYEFSPTI